MPMKTYLKCTIAVVLAFLPAVTSSVDAKEDYSIVQRIDSPTLKSMGEVLTWQRSFIDLSQRQLEAKLGLPNRTERLEDNVVTKKPMRDLIYRLTKNSDVRFTIHDGTVAAAVIILMPSENENEPKR
jgi:hypothetical protein